MNRIARYAKDVGEKPTRIAVMTEAERRQIHALIATASEGDKGAALMVEEKVLALEREGD